MLFLNDDMKSVVHFEDMMCNNVIASEKKWFYSKKTSVIEETSPLAS